MPWSKIASRCLEAKCSNPEEAPLSAGAGPSWGSRSTGSCLPAPSHTQPGPGCCPCTWLMQGHPKRCPSVPLSHLVMPPWNSLPPAFTFYFMTTSSLNSSSSLISPKCQVSPIPTAGGSLICHLLSTPKEQMPWTPLDAGSILCPHCHASPMKSHSNLQWLPSADQIRYGLAGIQSPEQAGPKCCSSLIPLLLTGSNLLYLPN